MDYNKEIIKEFIIAYASIWDSLTAWGFTEFYSRFSWMILELL